MRNRAKCKLCGCTIESFFRDDIVLCSCEEIGISGGPDSLDTYAKDYRNFLRVDDDGTEQPVKYIDRSSLDISGNKLPDQQKELTKKELIEILHTMISNDEKLPEQARHAALSYYDLLRYMLVILNIIKKDSNA